VPESWESKDSGIFVRFAKFHFLVPLQSM
jgi:hypothetical protein